VSIDARNIVTDPQGIQPHFDKLQQDGINASIIYLDSDDATLIDRFNATRRKHPLSSEKTSLAEAIEQEAHLLDSIAEQADLRIDTSNLNIYDLRDIIKQQLQENSQKAVAIQFQSFGFKRGAPNDCDFVFDVRCLPNPYWEVHLRPYTGQDQQVVDFLEQDFSVRAMLSDISSFLDKWFPSIIASSRNYITIGIGCTGGQHRSVYTAEQLAKRFKDQYPQTLVRHRDLRLANKD
jgi:UPF0042 nucleotide-binding protein